MKCREFFDANLENREFCKLLQKLPEDQIVGWESCTASAHSPGVVTSNEQLCRRVEDPTHFDNVTGTIKPTFFDDASSKGASCFRLLHTTLAQIENGAREHVAEVNKSPLKSGLRIALGYTTISALDVRKIVTEDILKRRGAGVFDTALLTDPSHADICQFVSGKQAGKSIRARLWHLARDRLVTFDSPSDGR